ncbi:hypothetical protein WOLCODRAFT_141441 [Wolfiporia cocos MD-104 SS10]|uniref:F-box domain-containing protein n=1 Tax=Wolfiporia cocos (strain MD-104) TaxID=742152 RepID=A0A2H3J8J0_WOLCO|nr:hypothetical protein WOLCODRAFT_141441 [Wolfiporia cocos MD-104 SS10]
MYVVHLSLGMMKGVTMIDLIQLGMNYLTTLVAGIRSTVLLRFSASQSQLVQRSTIAPVYQMPLEILAEIFSIVAESDRWALDSDMRIAISHVCRRWRAVALEHPRLWAFINIPRDLSNLDDLLKRSKRAPLSVYVEIRSDLSNWRPGCLDILYREAWRLKRLYIATPASCFGTITICSAPILESLYIDVNDIDGESDIQSAERFNIPLSWHSLFDNPNQPLHTLSLQQHSIPWHVTLPSSLQTLCLASPATTQLRMENVLLLLSQLPNLRRLELLLKSVPVSALPDDASTIVSLAHLQRLILIWDIAGCISLIDHLSFPSEITLSIVSLDSALFTVNCLVDRLDAKLSYFRSLPSLDIVVEETGLLVVGFLDPGVSVGWNPSHQKLFLAFITPPPHSSFECLAVLERMPLIGLRSLCLNGAQSLRDLSTLMLLDRLDTLEALEIGGGISLSQFFDLLLHQRPKPHRTPPFFLPSLRHLKLANYDFTVSDTSSQSAADLSSLVNFQHKRSRRANMRLSSLTFHDCTGISDVDRRALERALGATVTLN